MYFYIVEQPKSVATSRLHARIREYLNSIGIYGEFALASPARTAEELASMAITKGYNTIVVIGSDLTVNKVARVIASAEKTVMGIIPIDPNQYSCQLVGTTDWRLACDALKARQLGRVNLNFIPPNKYFITDAAIFSQADNPTDLVVDNEFIAKFTFTQLRIHPNLIIELFDEGFGSSKLQKGINWLFGRQPRQAAYSVFHGIDIRLSAKKPLFVVLGSEIVAKTPLSIELKPEGLKIITISGTIQTNQQTKESTSARTETRR